MIRKIPPLKLWGTWAGLAVGFVFSVFTYVAIDDICSLGCNLTSYFLPFLPVLIGFILGWGLHSMFAKE
jgi:hypothetical protein